MEALNTNKQRIKLQANGIVRYVNLSEIVYLQADDNYTFLILNDQTKHTVCKTLSNFEGLLGIGFIRCHKSYLVNPMYIREINKRSHELLLSTGKKITYSRSKVKMLEGMIQNKEFVHSNSLIVPSEAGSKSDEISLSKVQQVFANETKNLSRVTSIINLNVG